MSKSKLLVMLAALGLAGAHRSASAAAPSSDSVRGTVVVERIASTVLRENLTGLNPERVVHVYLPPGYANSGRAYPVVYFCHNINWSAAQVFADGNLARLIERGVAAGVVDEFIVVAADYSTPMLGSLYENSPVTGRWLDFTVRELVPFIDGKFRTLRQRESRALLGDFMGGRGALKLAMTHADVFGVAYALHPVATGAGDLPTMYNPVDWPRVHRARTFAELAGPGREQIFVAIAQAFLPNPDRPPFFCDFFVELEDGQPKVHPGNLRTLQKGFHLDESIDACAANLRSLRGLAFDWARHDSTQAHVTSAREFSRKLLDAGVEHEAEEYLGSPWDKNWLPNGRFSRRVLPFFGEHLLFVPVDRP